MQVLIKSLSSLNSTCKHSAKIKPIAEIIGNDSKKLMHCNQQMHTVQAFLQQGEIMNNAIQHKDTSSQGDSQIIQTSSASTHKSVPTCDATPHKSLSLLNSTCKHSAKIKPIAEIIGNYSKKLMHCNQQMHTVQAFLQQGEIMNNAIQHKDTSSQRDSQIIQTSSASTHKSAPTCDATPHKSLSSLNSTCKHSAKIKPIAEIIGNYSKN